MPVLVSIALGFLAFFHGRDKKKPIGGIGYLILAMMAVAAGFAFHDKRQDAIDAEKKSIENAQLLDDAARARESAQQANRLATLAFFDLSQKVSYGVFVIDFTEASEVKNAEGEIEYSDKPIDPDFMGSLFWSKPDGPIARLWFSFGESSYQYEFLARPKGVLEVRRDGEKPIYYSRLREGCVSRDPAVFDKETLSCQSEPPSDGAWFMDRIAGSMADGIELRPKIVAQRVLATAMDTERFAQITFLDVSESKFEKIKDFYTNVLQSELKFYVRLKKDAAQECQKAVRFPLKHEVERSGTSVLVSFVRLGNLETTLCEEGI